LIWFQPLIQMDPEEPDDDENFIPLYISVVSGYHLASSPKSQMTKMSRIRVILIKCILDLCRIDHLLILDSQKTKIGRRIIIIFY